MIFIIWFLPYICVKTKNASGFFKTENGIKIVHAFLTWTVIILFLKSFVMDKRDIIFKEMLVNYDSRIYNYGCMYIIKHTSPLPSQSIDGQW